MVQRVCEEVETVLNQIIEHCFGRFEDLSKQIQATAREELTKL